MYKRHEVLIEEEYTLFEDQSKTPLNRYTEGCWVEIESTKMEQARTTRYTSNETLEMIMEVYNESYDGYLTKYEKLNVLTDLDERTLRKKLFETTTMYHNEFSIQKMNGRLLHMISDYVLQIGKFPMVNQLILNYLNEFYRIKQNRKDSIYDLGELLIAYRELHLPIEIKETCEPTEFRNFMKSIVYRQMES